MRLVVAGGAYSAPPGPLAGLRGKRGVGKGERREWAGMEKGGERRKRGDPHMS